MRIAQTKRLDPQGLSLLYIRNKGPVFRVYFSDCNSLRFTCQLIPIVWLIDRCLWADSSYASWLDVNDHGLLSIYWNWSDFILSFLTMFEGLILAIKSIFCSKCYDSSIQSAIPSTFNEVPWIFVSKSRNFP